MSDRAVRIRADDVTLGADLSVPAGPRGVVAFAHGTGSSRFSPRNRFVATVLQEAGFATLLLDLLTEDEEAVDVRTAELRFDVPFLARRLAAAVAWLRAEGETGALALGAFGASTGAAAALVVAAESPEAVGAVVSRGGRPDLAGDALPRVRAPTLLIVGGADPAVLDLNREAEKRLAGEAALEVVPDAGHLFEEPGALGRVAELARDWFARHLTDS